MEPSENYFLNEDNNCFKNKNIIITGPTGGIGTILVETLYNLGANLLLIARNQTKLQEKFDHLLHTKPNYDNKTSPSYEIIDLEKPKQITDKFPSVIKKLKGKLDILLICHGKYSFLPIRSASVKDFDYSININVRSVFHLLSLSTPFLKITKGNVVILSSIEARIPTKGGALNTISKSMVNSLIQCSALELASFGVRVNGVAPGITYTSHRVNKEFKEKENEKWLKSSGNLFLLNKRVLNPQDIVHTVLFLASDDAEFITGEIIENDNGFGLNHDMTFSEEEE